MDSVRIQICVFGSAGYRPRAKLITGSRQRKEVELRYSVTEILRGGKIAEKNLEKINPVTFQNI